MPRYLLWIATAALAALAACAAPETYPVSGEDCTAEDPVQDLSAYDCTVV